MRRCQRYPRPSFMDNLTPRCFSGAGVIYLSSSLCAAAALHITRVAEGTTVLQNHCVEPRGRGWTGLGLHAVSDSIRTYSFADEKEICKYDSAETIALSTGGVSCINHRGAIVAIHAVAVVLFRFVRAFETSERISSFVLSLESSILFPLWMPKLGALPHAK